MPLLRPLGKLSISESELLICKNGMNNVLLSRADMNVMNSAHRAVFQVLGTENRSAISYQLL